MYRGQKRTPSQRLPTFDIVLYLVLLLRTCRTTMLFCCVMREMLYLPCNLFFYILLYHACRGTKCKLRSKNTHTFEAPGNAGSQPESKKRYQFAPNNLSAKFVSGNGRCQVIPSLVLHATTGRGLSPTRMMYLYPVDGTFDLIETNKKTTRQLAVCLASSRQKYRHIPHGLGPTGST